MYGGAHNPLPMMCLSYRCYFWFFFYMKKYLYLNKAEWIKTWIEGGKIPLALASKYLSDSRSTTFTPDENIIHESPIDLTSLKPLIAFSNGGGVKGLTITETYLNGRRMPDIIDANYYKEDGLVLCFSNCVNKNIAIRLGKYEQACVEINDIESLKVLIDKQLGVVGQMNRCEYTNDHRRNHFLKSKEDAWQDEYRFFWPALEERWVKIPCGIGRELILS